MSSSRSRASGPVPQSVAELASGHVLDGRYRVLERIGRGGFGDVWRAVELLPDGTALRDVALKLLSPQFADSDWSEEAKLLASFSHPSLVTIYAAGVLEGLGAPFVAMELLLGETLAETLRRTPKLPWRVALRFAREVAQALDVIHQRGVIHLDLKPANVFVTREGRVKVLDFGISRSAGEKLSQARPAPDTEAMGTLPTAVFLAESSDPFAATQMAEGTPDAGQSHQKVVVGTPGYVAPEVLELGEPSMLADAYALGVALAVLSTGHLPQDVGEEPADDAGADAFRTYWMRLREATLRGALRDLGGHGLPRGVLALIERLVSVDPQRRRVSEGGLGRVLEEVWQRPHGAPEAVYPGLSAFGPEHEGFLFGRGDELLRMTRHLGFERLLLVAGPTGAGKTSFVAAGLLPELERSGIGGRMDVRTAITTMRRGPERALAAALSELGVVPGPGESDLSALARAPDGVAHLLVLDDLEQLPSFPEQEQRRIVALLEGLLTTPASASGDALRVVAMLDSEGIEALVALSTGLSPLPSMVRYLAPPAEAAAREIAIEPATLAGFAIDAPEIVTRMVEAEISRGGVPLPAVALLLAAGVIDGDEVSPTVAVGGRRSAVQPQAADGPRMRRLSGKRLRELGGVAAAYARHAESALEQAGGEPSRYLDVLVSLTSSEADPLRVPLAALRDRLGAADVDALIEKLVSSKLIRVRGGEVELSHPSLAAWSKLSNARLERLEEISFFERVELAAGAWERSSMDKSYLDRGDLLRAFERHARKGVRGLSGLEVEFLAASRRARWRRRVVLAGLALCACVLLVSGFLYRRSLEHKRQVAEAAEQRASQEARRVRLIARARQSADPYARVAYLVAALHEGASEPALYIELLGAAHNLPPGRFLTLGTVEALAMPWDDRWVIGQSPSGTLVVFDLKAQSTEPEVIDHLDVSIDPTQASVVFQKPRRFDLHLGGAPLIDLVPIAFDTALVTLDSAGAVSVVRLRENGEVALAARSPLQCRGDLTVAARAPAVACFTGAGVGVWNFQNGRVSTLADVAGAFELSPDGRSVVSWNGAEIKAWSVERGEAVAKSTLTSPVRTASISPREAVVAVATEQALLLLDDKLGELMRTAPTDDTVALRWDEGGLDLAVCRMSGLDHWVFLQKGARPVDRPAPKARCDRASTGAPRYASSRFDLGSLGLRDFGEHFSHGAFGLSRKRWLSNSLVLASEQDDALERVLTFKLRAGKSLPAPAAGDGLSKIVRVGDTVAVERARSELDISTNAAPEIVIADAMTGERRHAQRGYLLQSCAEGRIAAYRVEGTQYVIFDVVVGGELGRVAREPGLVVGLGPSCDRLYTQRLDGTLEVRPFGGGPPRAIASARGFVFDVEPSRAFPGGGAGVLASLSSGEIVRIDESSDSLRQLAVASPRATGIADGAAPGEVLFADATGVYSIRTDGAVELLAGPRAGTVWEDLFAVQGGRAVVLAGADQIAVLEPEAGAITGSVAIRGMTRFSGWDADGSVLAYAPDVEGIQHGLVLPFGSKIPDAVGALASNLRVDEKGALILKR